MNFLREQTSGCGDVSNLLGEFARLKPITKFKNNLVFIEKIPFWRSGGVWPYVADITTRPAQAQWDHFPKMFTITDIQTGKTCHYSADVEDWHAVCRVDKNENGWVLCECSMGVIPAKVYPQPFPFAGHPEFVLKFFQPEFKTRARMPDFPTVDPKIEAKFEKAIEVHCPDFTVVAEDRYKLTPVWDSFETDESDDEEWWLEEQI